MARKYTKVEGLAEIIRQRESNGETNREIAESYGMTKYQARQLIARQNRKELRIAAGYIPRPKGRTCKETASKEAKRNNEVVLLRMQVELLRNFLYEAGRR